MCIIFGTLIYLQTILSAIGGIKCSWSSQTLQTVTSCPENTDEMKVRDRKKNCESIARKQNCTKPEKFKYHCVMNALENALIEVCAPEYRIYGYCTEYNEVGTVIQEHYNRKCADVTPPCASTYLSTESYSMYFPTCVFLSKLNMFIFNKINKDLNFIKCLIKISAVHLNDFFHLCVLNVT